MDGQEMHEMLASLRTELARAGPIDEESREQLRGLMEDLGRLLERPEEHEEDTPRTLSRRLIEAARKFELDHPTLANGIGQLAETLNKAGI